MLKRKSWPFLTSLLLLHSTFIQAYEPYHATIFVSGDSDEVSASNISEFIEEINETIPTVDSYTSTSPASLSINLRGLKAIAAFAANSTTLTVFFPNTGITETFAGASRDESIALFKDYLKDNGNQGQTLFKAYAKFSPIDPIAGNPNSLMAQMGQADFQIGRLSPLRGCNCCWSSQPIIHQFQAGMQLGRAFSDKFDTTIVSLPLRYSYCPSGSYALILDAPLSLLKNGGAYSAVGSVGMGLHLPISNRWSLTPTFRMGFGGSIDLATAGCFFSPGVISTYDFPIGNYLLTMTNFASYYCSTPLHLGGVNFDYHLHNYLFKNGLTLTSCKGFLLCGRPIRFSLSFTDSDFEGDSLFIQHYEEVAFSLITTHLNPYLDYDCLTLGFSYAFGQKSYKGFYLNLAYQF
jgi:hypothetical protein